MGEIEKILKKINTTLRKGKNNLMIPALNAGLENMQRRVFTDARAVPNKKYSTEPYYQSLTPNKGAFKKPTYTASEQINNSKFRPRGKFSRKSKFKNGKTRKTMYLKEGYKEFRERAGRQTNKINFDLTGDLRLSIQVGIQGGDTVIGIATQEEVNKKRGLEKKYKQPIFAINEDDLKVIEKALLKELDNLFKNI